MTHKNNNTNLDNMLFLLLEGGLDEDGMQSIKTWLSSSPEAKKYYCEFINDYAAMKYHVNSMIDTDEEASSIASELDAEIWSSLAEYEKVAPVIEVNRKQPPPQRELIQKVVYPPRETRPINKFSIIFLALNVAAILFLVFFLKFTPPQKTIEVATVSDSINAKWDDANASMRRGTRLITMGNKMLLREGLAELTFDNHTKAVIEAPAEFQILADDRIGMMYGKIYTTVPPNAVGFSVYTPNAKVIDMGTEFGVQVDFNGNTQLSVQKGKIMLLAGDVSTNKDEVLAGVAKRISGTTGEISDIEFRSDYFVRGINSESNSIWRGQSTINLADIVGGGNGLGTGKVDMGIDPISGTLTKSAANNNGITINEYRPVLSTPFIDGIFIPNGRMKQIISSKGHIFKECPITSGDWFISPENVMRTLDSELTQDPVDSGSPFVPCIVMHANMGITYDLQAIRSIVPEAKTVRFRSKIGVGSETDRQCNADFWVLVDGELRYKKTRIIEKEKYYSVDIKLSENDRFLTLVTTDGGDLEDQAYTSIDSDWCRYAEPTLILE